MDQSAYVVLDQFRLSGPEPLEGGSQKLCQEQRAGHQPGKEENGARGLPGGPGPDRVYELVHKEARQIDGGRGKESLDREKNDPGNGVAPPASQTRRTIRRSDDS